MHVCCAHSFVILSWVQKPGPKVVWPNQWTFLHFYYKLIRTYIIYYSFLFLIWYRTKEPSGSRCQAISLHVIRDWEASQVKDEDDSPFNKRDCFNFGLFIFPRTENCQDHHFNSSNSWGTEVFKTLIISHPSVQPVEVRE